MAEEKQKLDDVMLAMDVVDTLRHEQMMVEKDLNAEDRRQALIERLRGIYKAQGISVPDSVLMDGVMALEEQRFAYEPPKSGFMTSLAKAYINRSKWMPMVYTLAAIIIGVNAINYVGFVRPAQLQAEKTERLLTQTLPQTLSEARDKALSVASTEALRQKAAVLYAAGDTAIANKDVRVAEEVTADLEAFAADLSQDYTLRIVSRPGEMSGVFRLNDDGPTQVRNYYLIVEGINAAGSAVTVRITSEEDQKTKRVKQWGVRVPQAVFNRVAADKRDDQIIQNAVIGHKKRGFTEPDYAVETSGGTILEW